MQVDNEYLRCMGLGLQGLRASGQFCDAMVCVGSTRILVHKVVLSAASKTLHDLALEFDMTPHRERDQLEIIIPSDVSLFAVNMFINFLYTGQLDLNSRVVSHVERLASLFGVSQLQRLCQEYIQRNSPPDSQNLNLQLENQIEPDSSINGVQPSVREERLISTPDDTSQGSCHSRSNSVCSGMGGDLGSGLAGVIIKTEPGHLSTYETASSKPASPAARSTSSFGSLSLPDNLLTNNKPGQNQASMSMLEKLMCPTVNLKKLPSNITPNTVVMVSDDEGDENTASSKSTKRKPSQFTLAEKEAIAIEAKRYGTTQVANSKNIPLPDILSWMTLFGLRNLGNQRLGKLGKQVNHEADLSLVRWIVQQQELNGCVDLNNMKQYALTVHQQTNPKFCASKTWLGNFLQRNMSVLQGTKFVHGDKGDELDVYGNMDLEGATVKQEAKVLGGNILESLGQESVLENIPLNEQILVNKAVESGLNHDDNDDNYLDDDYNDDNNDIATIPNENVRDCNFRTVETPFGKRPIIIGQSKAFDPKSERKIVQWVLERNARDGYVFTDDFKDYARSLYKGEKVFGATQAWMKKFLRRNRALKDVKFCSKFKNVYTTEDKVNSIVLAKRYGVAYASKHTGLNQKVIHCWKLAYEKGMLNVDQSALMKIETMCSNLATQALPSSIEIPSTSTATISKPSLNQASHGIVPEFEQRIVQEIKDLQAQEGSVNYSDISKISQSVYKETRPNFKASYNWVKSFLDRHKEALIGLELENVSKVLIEDTDVSQELPNTSNLNDPKITEMVDQALLAIGGDSERGGATGKPKQPVVVGPSVMFDRKTERKLVEWALAKQHEDGYVFTDDFKLYAKSVHTGPKHFSASSGWLTLFLRRHHILKDVQWRSKYKNNYTEEEKITAVLEAKRFGTGHVGRKLGIEPKLISAWRFKFDKQKVDKQVFWKGTKIRKFGKGIKSHPIKHSPVKHTALSLGGSDAARGIVPEFEHRIVDMILEEHKKEGSISYEEMSKIAQSVYKETRPTFKASYAWIRNFMKRNEERLTDLDIDNVKKVFMPEEDEVDSFGVAQPSTEGDSMLQKIFQRRPIIVGQSRSLDTKTEKKLVQWTVEQQEKNGYVFLDQFKSYAQSLYKGEKKFAATQAWRIKFLRRNHAALKHIKFQSSFRNQYSLAEKKAIVIQAKQLGAAHVAKTTGIEHCLINAWRLKLERSGMISPDDYPSPQASVSSKERPNFASKLQGLKNQVGPGLYSHRGIVPALEQKIVGLIMNKMDQEGSVTYQDVCNCARAVYRETRPHFKGSYHWIKEFIKRHKKDLRHVEFESGSKQIAHDMDIDTEVLIPEDNIDNVAAFLAQDESSYSETPQPEASTSRDDSWVENPEMDIVIDNPEDPNYESHYEKALKKSSSELNKAENLDISKIVAKRPIIIGKSVHFTRKTEKKIVEWLLDTQNKEGFVFTDDLRRYARSLYTGPPEKFGATNAWITKFLRRNKLEGKIEFQSKLKGNNVKFEGMICDLILEQQEKEGSVSHDDIQRLTQSVYKETRPNFRACYGWIKDFLKRNQEKLKGVDLENVKKVYIPDGDASDGVLIQNYDPSKSLPFLDSSLNQGSSRGDSVSSFHDSHDSSWFDLDSSVDLDTSRSVLDKLANQKRPVIIGPPRGMDSKTEKKLVHWMQQQQAESGCVYLDLFKDYAKSIHSGPKKFAATQAWMTKFKQRNHDALRNVVIKSRFRNEYSMEDKLRIVEEAKRLGCNHVGRKYGINGGVIYSWKVQLETMERLEGGGSTYSESSSDMLESSSRGIVPEFESSIVSMVLETQRAKGSVSYDDISMCARSVYKETRPNFKASNNWVMDFIRKYKEDFKDVNFENQRKFHSEEEKLHILSEEKKYGTEHVVKKRNISASTLYQWKRNMQSKSIPIPKYKAIVSSKIKKKYAKGKNVKTYTIEEKRNLVRMAEANGITHTSLKLGISRTMLGKWIRYFRDQGENIVINSTHSSTMKKELVQKVVAWVLEENNKLGIVVTNRIVEYAKKVFEEAYTGFNATQNWLESFLAQNSEKFANVRFRDTGDRDLDFSDEIKLKLSRYAEKHGAIPTADLAGLQPKLIYHWRRTMKQKGHDLSVDPPPTEYPITQVKVENPSPGTEPKSLMQQKLDRIAAKYSIRDRRDIVSEANVNGASATASKHKLPLPLLLKWMKLYIDGNNTGSSSVSRSASVSSEDSRLDRSSQEKLKVRFPSFEKTTKPKEGNIIKKRSKEYKRQIIEEAKRVGVKEVCERTGIGNSTLYYWLKEDRESSAEGSSSRSSLDRESLTPIRIKDIKKEPGVTDTPPSSSVSPMYSPTQQQKSSPLKQKVKVSGQSYGKIVRKYTDQQKYEVAQRAHEIGYKQASVELNIPLTNVKRWFDMYKSKFIVDALQKKSEEKQKAVSATGSSLYSVSTPGSTAGTKRSLPMNFKALSPTIVAKRSKYTEEEKINFVKESELNGTNAAAAKAGVSLDVLYQWRSKYRKVIKFEKDREVSEAVMRDSIEKQFQVSGEIVETDLPLSPEMPAPRNTMFDPGVKTSTVEDNKDNKTTEAEHADYLDYTVNKSNDEESEDYEITCNDIHSDVEHENTVVNSESAQSLGFSQRTDFSVSEFEENSNDEIGINNTTNVSSDVHSIDDIDIIAADQILEMTSSYLEAEKEHERDPFGYEKIEHGNKEPTNDNSLSMVTDESVIVVNNALDTKTSKKTESGEEKAESEVMDLIQIVDIKSEAAPSKG